MSEISVATFNTLHGQADVRAFADVIGWQEADTATVRQRIKGLAAQGYSTYVPPGALSAIPISWSAEFELRDSGWWKAHDGRSGVSPHRGFSWVRLKHRASGVIFFVINTHMISGAWSHTRPDTTWRRTRWTEHLHEMGDFAVQRAQFGTPVVILGDMNRHVWLPIPGFGHASTGSDRAPYDQILCTLPLSRAKRGAKHGSDHHVWTATLNLTPPKEDPVTTGIYLEDHKPARSQFRVGRRAKPSGLIEVHTAESVMDTVGVDTGAEAVASFIQRRSEPGSYHRLVDSDTVVKLVRLGNEAYGDGTGTNSYAVHLSFACKTTDWNKMSAAKRKAFLRQGAKAVVEIMHWLKTSHGVTVPLKKITKAQATAGNPGFMAHGVSDPGRRSDPGTIPPNLFPWDEFFAEIRALLTPSGPKQEMTRGGNIDKALEYLRKARPADENKGTVAAAISLLRKIKPWPKKR